MTNVSFDYVNQTKLLNTSSQPHRYHIFHFLSFRRKRLKVIIKNTLILV